VFSSLLSDVVRLGVVGILGGKKDSRFEEGRADSCFVKKVALKNDLFRP